MSEIDEPTEELQNFSRTLDDLHAPQRLIGESFDNYVKRRKLSNMNIKHNCKNGNVFWNSSEMGTFMKANNGNKTKETSET